MSKIIITSLAIANYRRGGSQFTPGVNTFSAEHFSAEQLVQIQQDPRLRIEGDVLDQASTHENSQGALDADSISELVALIKSLDPENKELWKVDGTPKASAFPKDTPAALRDAAWDAFTSNLDQASKA